VNVIQLMWGVTTTAITIESSQSLRTLVAEG
jgi:hypothetical protein